MPNGKVNGKVKFFSEAKGYGFITIIGTSDDVFVHATDLRETGLDKLLVDQLVSFEIEQRRKGPRAVNVAVL